MLAELLEEFKLTAGSYFATKEQHTAPLKSATQRLLQSQGVLDSQEKLNSSLRSSLRECLRIPLRVEAYFWLYALFGIYTTLKTIVLIPLDIIRGMAGSLLSIMTLRQSAHSTLIPGFIVLLFLLFDQPIRLFDISYLYHAFRGQSTLKLYGLVFAFEIAQKIFTMSGQYVMVRLRKQLEEKDRNVLSAIPEMLAFACLMGLHTFSIYLQFNVYMVVMNSTMQNFIIFCFVINLTKMKSTAFKKFQLKSYKNQINYDAKDRMQKIIYVLLFQLSQPGRNIPQFGAKLSLIFLLGSLIEHFKHATVLLLARKQHTLSQLKEKLHFELYCEPIESSVNKCVQMDFTLIPFTVFTLRMGSVILWANYDNVNETIGSFYLGLCAVTGVLKIGMVMVRRWGGEQKV